MSAKPLTKKEQKWLDKLEKVMCECPSKRMACYTIGDNNLTFYDENVSNQWELDNPREEPDAGELHIKAGSYLGEAIGTFAIDSCAG